MLNVLYCVTCKNLESIRWVWRVENPRNLCEVDSLPEESKLNFQRSFSSCCSEQHPDMAYWCRFHLREFPPSWPPGHVFMKYFKTWQLIWGLLRVWRSRPHPVKVLRVNMKLNHDTHNNPSPVILSFFFNLWMLHLQNNSLCPVSMFSKYLANTLDLLDSFVFLRASLVCLCRDSVCKGLFSFSFSVYLRSLTCLWHFGLTGLHDPSVCACVRER